MEEKLSDSFSSRKLVIKKELTDRSETISNRFLMSKLVYRMIFDKFATFSIFGLFSSKCVKNYPNMPYLDQNPKFSKSLNFPGHPLSVVPLVYISHLFIIKILLWSESIAEIRNLCHHLYETVRVIETYLSISELAAISFLLIMLITTVLGWSSVISESRPQNFFPEGGGVLPLLGTEVP